MMLHHLRLQTCSSQCRCCLSQRWGRQNETTVVMHSIILTVSSYQTTGATSFTSQISLVSGWSPCLGRLRHVAEGRALQLSYLLHHCPAKNTDMAWLPSPGVPNTGQTMMPTICLRLGGCSTMHSVPSNRLTPQRLVELHLPGLPGSQWESTPKSGDPATKVLSQHFFCHVYRQRDHSLPTNWLPCNPVLRRRDHRHQPGDKLSIFVAKQRGSWTQLGSSPMCCNTIKC